MPAYYPVNLDIRNRRCVVFGGGGAGEFKVLRLHDFEAKVIVISPDVTDAVKEIVDGDKVTWIQREYHPGDLEGAFIAIAALEDGPMAQAIAKEAEERNVLLNVEDVTYLCTFIFPSMVRRGDVIAAMSTGGASPALARKFRELLSGSPVESRHPVMDYAELAGLLADVRQEIRRTDAGKAIFADHWQSCITDRLVDLVVDGNYDTARESLMSDLNFGMECDCENRVCKMWEKMKQEAEQVKSGAGSA